VGGYRPQDLLGCQRLAAGPIPPRAGNVSMDSSRLTSAIGFQPFDPWPADEAFVPTHPDWHRERTSDWQGSPSLLQRVLYYNPRRRTIG
jgi:dTDP-4-dehydrorhamnose reductase